MSEVTLRRKFFRQCFSAALQLTFISAIAESCEPKENEKAKETKAVIVTDPCGDFSGTIEEDIKKRESLGYVKVSPLAKKQCGNCNLWLPPGDPNSCGKCQLFKGPVPPTAYCTYWAPQV